MPRTAGATSAGAKRPSTRRDSGEGLSGPHCSQFCSFLTGRRAWIPVFRSLLSIIPSGSAAPDNGKYILLAGGLNPAALAAENRDPLKVSLHRIGDVSLPISAPNSNPRLWWMTFFILMLIPSRVFSSREATYDQRTSLVSGHGATARLMRAKPKHQKCRRVGVRWTSLFAFYISTISTDSLVANPASMNIRIASEARTESTKWSIK
jgi:hypothetical protein